MEISIADGRSDESSGYKDFTLTLSQASAGTVTVGYRTVHGSALEGIDYQDRSGTVTFAAGETSKTISVYTYNDNIDETDEFFEVELFDPTGGATLEGGGDTLRAFGWILDNDGSADDRALAVSSPMVIEGDSGTRTALFRLGVSEASADPIQVNYQTRDGDARAGQDYNAKSGLFTFAPGQTSGTVEVEVRGDTQVEASERFSLVTTPGAGIHSGATGSVGEARILDDDSASMTLSIDDVRISEASGYQEFTVTLSEASAGTVTVGWRTVQGTALEGADYQDRSGTLTFAAGETSKVVSVYTYNDSVDETDEFFEVELFSPTGGAKLEGGVPTTRGTGWILDNDGSADDLAMKVDDPKIVEGDSGEREAVFGVSLSRDPQSSLSLSYQTRDGEAAAGSDYVAASGSLNFAAGQTYGAVAVKVKGDGFSEPSERFALVFDPPAAVHSDERGAEGVATIIDDDAATPTITLDSGSVSESSGYKELIVTLSEPASGTVTVNWRTHSGTATAGTDFQDRSGTLTFAAGETSKTLSVYTYRDNLDETDEFFTVELSSPSNASLAGGASTASSTVWILDDDGSANNRALRVHGENGSESGRPATFVAELSRPTANNVTINYNTVNGTAKAGSDYKQTSGSLTILAGQTIAAAQVPILNDRIYETGENFSISGTLGSGGGQVFAGKSIFATAVIADNDPKTVYEGTPTGETIKGTSRNETFHAKGGNDVVYAGAGADVAFGEDGDDTLYGGDGADKLDGGDGNDQLYGGNGNDQLYGGEGDDRHYGGGGKDRMFGAGGDDYLQGDDGNDRLEGSGGSDPLDGGGGNDVILGGAGADTLRGGAGDDALNGGDGDDTLNGGAGGDKLIGSAGHDKMYGDAGADTLKGGAGNDNIHGGDGFDKLIGGGGKNVLYGDSGNDRIEGGKDVDKMYGGAGKDRMIGGAGKDLMRGGGGNDDLSGGGGADKLFGDAGIDRIDGGKGNDILKGGGGKDFFEFTRGTGHDSIADFNPRIEKIDLSGYRGVNGFADLDISHVKGGVLVELAGNDSILIEDVALGAIGKDDFIF